MYIDYQLSKGSNTCIILNNIVFSSKSDLIITKKSYLCFKRKPLLKKDKTVNTTEKGCTFELALRSSFRDR